MASAKALERQQEGLLAGVWEPTEGRREGVGWAGGAGPSDQGSRLGFCSLCWEEVGQARGEACEPCSEHLGGRSPPV